MRNLLFVLLALLVILGTVGYVRHWYSVTTKSNDDKVGVAVTVDKEVVKEDQAKAKEKLTELGERIKEKVQPATEPISYKTAQDKIETNFKDLSKKIDTLKEQTEQLQEGRTEALTRDLDELLKLRRETAMKIDDLKQAEGKNRDDLRTAIDKDMEAMRKLHDRIKARLP